MGTETRQYSFKSVGKTQNNILNEPGRVTVNELPIGFRTPLQFEDMTDGLFVMHKSLISQVADNLKNLILTNHGERLIQSNLGASILPLAFELTNEEVDNTIMARITCKCRSFYAVY